MFRGEGPLRRLLRERMQRGPILKKLREEFFKASTRIIGSEEFDGVLSEDIR